MAVTQQAAQQRRDAPNLWHMPGVANARHVRCSAGATHRDVDLHGGPAQAWQPGQNNRPPESARAEHSGGCGHNRRFAAPQHLQAAKRPHAMPHLIVEYTHTLSDFPEAQVLAELNAVLCASPEIANEADLKSRCVCLHRHAVGTVPDAPRAFVHAQLRLLAGRTPEVKQALSGQIAEVLRRLIPRPAGTLVQLSVELVDMDRPSYIKERL